MFVKSTSAGQAHHHLVLEPLSRATVLHNSILLTLSWAFLSYLVAGRTTKKSGSSVSGSSANQPGVQRRPPGVCSAAGMVGRGVRHHWEQAGLRSRPWWPAL